MNNTYMGPMSTKEFFDLVDRMWEYRKSIMQGKGANEYASNDDRLKNFSRDESEAGIHRLQAHLVMLNKHIRAIQSFIIRLMNQTQQVRSSNQQVVIDWNSEIDRLELSEPIESRVADVMNYLDLLMAILVQMGYEPKHFQSTRDLSEQPTPGKLVLKE